MSTAQDMPIFTRDVRKYVFKKIFRVFVLRGAWLDWEPCEQVFCPRESASRR